MTMTPADTATTIMFAIYLVAMLLIGWLGYRATSNLSDYILGGRSLGSFVTALSAGASDMSGWLLMGLPGAVYASGLSESWIAIGLCIGAWLNWYLVAGRLRRNRAMRPYAWSSLTSRNSPDLSLKSKPIWTRNTATASPFCASAPANSSAA